MSQPPPEQQPDQGPVAFVQATGAQILAQASEMRAFVLPHQEEAPDAWREALHRIRGQLDRLEALRAQALTLRSTIRSGRIQHTQAAEEAWSSAAAADQRRGQIREFEGAKERAARFDLAAIGERRRMRQWEIAAEMADTVAEQVRGMHAGLRDARTDIIEYLRALAWESHLDRT